VGRDHQRVLRPDLHTHTGSSGEDQARVLWWLDSSTEALGLLWGPRLARQPSPPARPAAAAAVEAGALLLPARAARTCGSGGSGPPSSAAALRASSQTLRSCALLGLSPGCSTWWSVSLPPAPVSMYLRWGALRSVHAAPQALLGPPLSAMQGKPSLAHCTRQLGVRSHQPGEAVRMPTCSC
jgi:hypothetical protein